MFNTTMYIPFYSNSRLKKYIINSVNKSMEKYNKKNKDKDNINSLIKYYITPINKDDKKDNYDKFLFYNFIASGLLCFIIGYKLGKGLKVK